MKTQIISETALFGYFHVAYHIFTDFDSLFFRGLTTLYLSNIQKGYDVFWSFQLWSHHTKFTYVCVVINCTWLSQLHMRKTLWRKKNIKEYYFIHYKGVLLAIL